MIEFNNETVNVTDGDDHIALSVTTAGTKGDPAVILLHGFPETSLSWRHQLPALAEAGHFVIAADGRGFGNSDCPEAVEAYRIDQLTGDVVALAAHYGYDELVVVGHDWGSLIAGSLAAFRPDLVRALVLMSVPYQIRTSVSIPSIRKRRASSPSCAETGPVSAGTDPPEPSPEAPAPCPAPSLDLSPDTSSGTSGPASDRSPRSATSCAARSLSSRPSNARYPDRRLRP